MFDALEISYSYDVLRSLRLRGNALIELTPHICGPSTCHADSLDMPTLHIGPAVAEEMRHEVKGFTFIVIDI